MDVSEASGREPAHDFQVVMEELAGFSADLAAKPMFVVASKIDAACRIRSRSKAWSVWAKSKNLPFYAISSVTGQRDRDA